MNSSDRPQEFPLAREGGIAYTPSPDRDPLEALDDLMTVVEALIPTWPPREAMKEGKYWLL